ncbi:MAG: endolytic transglycosylase MltG [Patescibacteria group bacterium]
MWASLACAFVVFAVVVWLGRVPKDFPKEPVDIHVGRDSSISSIGQELFDEHIISSQFLFKVASTLYSKGRGVWAGDYRFSTPENVWVVAYRLVHGHQNLPKIRITIPEGTNVYDMAYIYLTELPHFNAARFVSLAYKYEGYLFPDTYYFLSNVTPEEIIKKMRATFNERIAPLEEDIQKSGKSLKDIVIMASIVEKEAYPDESRRIIAGILWDRLEDGMKLQVDAPFYYVTGKRGGFTLNDLKIDSPYNTYLYKGLPVAPISNPGLKAIADTINPTKTNYVYYLTGKDGEMRYAVTFDEHIENKNTYLR